MRLDLGQLASISTMTWMRYTKNSATVLVSALTEMIGYVTYTTSSPLYPHDDVLEWVRSHYDVYAPYSGYRMKGPRDIELNQAMDIVFKIREEYDTTGKYILPLEEGSYVSPPSSFLVPVDRRMYIVEDVGDGFYRQVRQVGSKKERYMVGIDIPIYIGSEGSFLLLDEKDDRGLVDLLRPT